MYDRDLARRMAAPSAQGIGGGLVETRSHGDVISTAKRTPRESFFYATLCMRNAPSLHRADFLLLKGAYCILLNLLFLRSSTANAGVFDAADSDILLRIRILGTISTWICMKYALYVSIQVYPPTGDSLNQSSTFHA
jgi:hypothetical protein